MRTQHNRLSGPGRAKRLAGLAVLAASAASATSVFATSTGTNYSTNQSVIANVESGYVSNGTSRLTAEGPASGGYANFGVADFSPFGLGLADATNATAVNGISLTLTDKNEYFAAPGAINFYLSDSTAATSGLSYQGTNSSPEGVGTQLNNLYLLGTGQYNSNGTGSAGTTLNYALTLPSGNATTALLNDINTGNNIRIVVTPTTVNGAADFQGSQSAPTDTPPLYAPVLNLNLNTAAAPASNAVLSLSSTDATDKSATYTFSRVVQGSNTATQAVTLYNHGTTGSAVYSLAGSDNTLPNSNGATGFGTVGTEPIAAGGSTTTPLTVGINTYNVTPGSVSSSAPATATVTIHNRSNTGDSTDSVITLLANQVVANRQISNAGGSSAVNFGNVLANGTTLDQNNVTLTTTNSTTGGNPVTDYTSNSLTTVTLKAGTTINAPTNGYGNLQSASYGDNSYVTMAAGASDVQFNGTQSTTRNFTYVVPTGDVGGQYINYNNSTTAPANYYIGYANFALAQNDTAIGAPTNPNGRIYVIANVYQSASVSATPSTTTGGLNYGQLTNALHTVNQFGDGNDHGLRDSAVVTGLTTPTLNAANTQNGFTIDSGFKTGAVIGDGQSINAADFANSQKLNGTYQAELDNVTLQNNQTGLDGKAISGATANDLGTVNYTLTTTVTGNTNDGTFTSTADVLKNESYAGYGVTSNIAGGSGTQLSFLGGAASNRNTIGVQFATTPTSSVVRSDVAAVSGFNTATGGTNGDTYVVQMNYNPASVSSTGLFNGAANSFTMGWVNSNGQFVAANYGNTGGTPTEVNGAYASADNTLGTYGIDQTNHVVWAVVNHTGQFAVEQRIAGDTNGNGSVGITDYGNVYNNVGATSGATWSQGSFTGSGAVTIADLTTVYNNLGSTANTPGTAAQLVKSADAIHTSLIVVPTGASPAATDVTLYVNRTTGDVQLRFNNQAIEFNSYQINSNGGLLTPTGLQQVTGFGTPRFGHSATVVIGVDSGYANGSYYTPTGGSFDLGDIFNAGSAATPDLSFQFGEFNPNNNGNAVTFSSAITYSPAVPEPATLSLLAIGGLGLLSRRRNRKSAA